MRTVSSDHSIPGNLGAEINTAKRAVRAALVKLFEIANIDIGNGHAGQVGMKPRIDAKTC